jgi:hypothetical protein
MTSVFLLPVRVDGVTVPKRLGDAATAGRRRARVCYESKSYWRFARKGWGLI